MKKIDVGQIFGVLANVGVLFGILLLVYELNQNRQMMVSQTRHAVAQMVVDLDMDIASNPELLDAMMKVRENEPLTTREDFIRRRQLSAMWRARESINYQYRQGLFEEDEYLAQRESWISNLNQARSMREYWCERETRLSPAFFSEINELIDDPCD